MTEFLRLSLVLLAAVNPGALHRGTEGVPRSMVIAATAAIAGYVLIFVVTLAGGPILDGLDIEPETFRIAAGVVMVVSGVLAMLPFTAPGLEGEPGDWRAGISPWGWPRLANPAVAAAALSWGADGDEATVIGAAIVPVALGAGALLLPGRAAPLTLAMGVTLGGLLIILGVARVVSGVRDI